MSWFNLTRLTAQPPVSSLPQERERGPSQAQGLGALRECLAGALGRIAAAMPAVEREAEETARTQSMFPLARSPWLAPNAQPGRGAPDPRARLWQRGAAGDGQHGGADGRRGAAEWSGARRAAAGCGLGAGRRRRRGWADAAQWHGQQQPDAQRHGPRPEAAAAGGAAVARPEAPGVVTAMHLIGGLLASGGPPDGPEAPVPRLGRGSGLWRRCGRSARRTIGSGNCRLRRLHCSWPRRRKRGRARRWMRWWSRTARRLRRGSTPGGARRRQRCRPSVRLPSRSCRGRARFSIWRGRGLPRRWSRSRRGRGAAGGLGRAEARCRRGRGRGCARRGSATRGATLGGEARNGTGQGGVRGAARPLPPPRQRRCD